MKISLSKNIFIACLIAVVMVTSFTAGGIAGYMAQPVFAAEQPAEFAVFWESWDLVLKHFVDRDQIDFTRMTYGAIQGMLNTLGDENHTSFLPPEAVEQEQSRMEGSFEGIGAYVSQENGVFSIVAPILGSPAESAGILAGDIVFAVDGEEISGQPQWEVIMKIRGPAGSVVTLTVLHPDADEPVDIEITRGRIDIESVLWSRIPETEYAYVQITQFAADTNKELVNALQEIEAASSAEQPIEGILLDLRNNPGGFLQQALLVGSHFLEEGDVILFERNANNRVSDYKAAGPGLAREIPLVVLVNEGSASAAEIVAGSLKENGRAKLIGETTLGTGTVLRPYTLSDGSVLRLGVTNWLTPKMELIKNQGVTPNITVNQNASVDMLDSISLRNLTAEELRTHEDRQFKMGLTFLKLRARTN